MINYINEIASSHTGKYELVKKISLAHLHTEANYLKFQIFKAKNLFQQKNSNYQNYKNLEISFKKWKLLINLFKKKTKLILEPFDKESYQFCKKFKKDVSIKISSSESDNIELINDALNNFNKVFLNISGIDFTDIKKILFYFKKKNIKKKLILMYGFQSYPTHSKDLRFFIFDYLKKKGFEYGYADHTKYGINKELINLCKYAKEIYNCKFIEKHVCHNLKEKPNDYITSINIKDVSKFINKVNQKNKIKKLIFSKITSLKEKKYFLNFIKFAYIKKNIDKLSKINHKDLIFLRSSSKNVGITRLKILNKKIISKKKLEKNDQLFSSSVKII